MDEFSARAGAPLRPARRHRVTGPEVPPGRDLGPYRAGGVNGWTTRVTYGQVVFPLLAFLERCLLAGSIFVTDNGQCSAAF